VKVPRAVEDEKRGWFMSALHAHQPARWLWWAGLLVAGFLVASSLAAHAEAAFGACRSDPLVTFPNGITVDLHATIGANLSDVRHVSYVLHGSQQDSAAPPRSSILTARALSQT